MDSGVDYNHPFIAYKLSGVRHDPEQKLMEKQLEASKIERQKLFILSLV